MIRNTHALCSCGHGHALHRVNEPHACLVTRGTKCRCTKYQAAIECRFCAGAETGICAACETEIGDLLPWRPRDAVGLHPL
jgi:hypothetical protein